MEDASIIELLFARNEQGITEAKKKYGKHCLKIAGNILGDPRDSEECVNDTWLAAWNRIPPERPGFLRAFLGRITRNLSVARLREKNRLKRGGGQALLAIHELEECISAGANVETEYIRSEQSAAINAFLRTLDSRDRDIFLCRYYYLNSAAEIAAAFGLSDSNVRMILSRKRKELKAYLEKEGLL